jgi:nucleotidyltransferase substrate binding protein (TIGR01987 family)
MTTDVRWIQRFQNYSKAFALLKEIIEERDDITTFRLIIKEGIIQRFEYTFELLWKTLKDKMVEDGLVIEKISPKFVFKIAYQSKYLDNIDQWLKMTNDRNLMSHTYDFSK